MVQPIALTRLIVRCSAPLVAMLCCTNASAQFDPRALYPEYPETSIIYYDVAGDTPMEVRWAIMRRGPPGNDGQGVDALTRWRVGWSLRSNASGGCDAEIQFETSITLPRLRDDSAFSDEEKLAWDRYLWALIDHEYGHVAIAYDALPALQYALESGPCETANERGQIVVDDTNWLQIQFDRDTRHGQLTGVQFP